MRVLVVEDDEDKSARLAAHMREDYGAEEVCIARSFQSGLRACLGGGFDLILLDMTMTNYDRSLDDDGGRPHHFAGREILRRLQREEVHVPVIVVTQFPRFGEDAESMSLAELTEELQSRFPDYKGTVHYRSNVDDWKVQLQSLLSGIGL